MAGAGTGSGLLSPEHRVLSLLRTAQRLERGGWLGVRLGAIVRFRMARAWGVHVHPKAVVGDIRLPHPTSIVIGAGSVVEDGVIIYQNVTIGSLDNDRRQYATIRAGAKLFAGSMVFGAVEVGADAVVGANSVVLRDVAAGATVVGSPAAPIGA